MSSEIDCGEKREFSCEKKSYCKNPPSEENHLEDITCAQTVCLTTLTLSEADCCSCFLTPQYNYHSVNGKVHANKNKSFLFCSGPPLYNARLCSCTALWKTNSAVQLGSSRQRKGNFNPIFFFFGTS